ncbi:MAG: phosphoglycerate kinase [Xanthomonadales bacterium]|nr:phosphoglycerate kinase [Xanthomonadales bacterium]NIN60635.1 phosphoglycerate kinase [Xanthomonadales bacterium]NIN75987.1 phosphoglycerate kinase [Xanthomonadales bacterium]NIO13040.1 phosphoglycerate kinase [Xanthomonadales bacterium]NIP13028.1 phosphoglycerate kinase [Xanthomonadales bacterium]
MSYLRMQDLQLSGMRVLIREDFNVPVEAGEVTSDQRIVAALPGISLALEQEAAVLLMSHLGRPAEGEADPRYSLAPVAACLARHLGREVRLETNWLDGVTVEPGEVVLCENVRFNRGEKGNDEALARQIARLCDIFVMDAFGSAHRAHASTEGVARHAPVACAGPLLAGELEALDRALRDPTRPLLAIVGGAKVSTKLSVLEALLERTDQLIVGGGIANTFIAATGHEVGKSLYEPDLIAEAQQLIRLAHRMGGDIPIPKDLLVAKKLDPDAEAHVRYLDEVQPDEIILDIGPLTAADYAEMVWGAGTVLWNGPVGVFEYRYFGGGTRAVAEAIAKSRAYSIAGGGDTLAAIDRFGVAGGVNYISTGGGAFLEYVEGKTLPAVAVLERRAVEYAT